MLYKAWESFIDILQDPDSNVMADTQLQLYFHLEFILFILILLSIQTYLQYKVQRTKPNAGVWWGEGLMSFCAVTVLKESVLLDFFEPNRGKTGILGFLLKVTLISREV